MTHWKLSLGNFLFKYRSFTPIPLILLVFVIFKPVVYGSSNWLINLGGLFISLLGEMIRILVVGFAHSGTSGREAYLRADRLNNTGIYSVVRNPLYIGNFLMFAGIVIVFSNLYALLVFTLFLIAQYYFVVLAEENFLRGKYGSDYEAYCKEVRRIIPVFKGYKKNQNPFNPGKVVFKENDSVFNMLMMFLLVVLYKEWYFVDRITNPAIYIVPGSLLIVAYVIVKIIKKRPRPE
jgi:protein-S-isoprenylcysteine O-methyltransferase Ste14